MSPPDLILKELNNPFMEFKDITELIKLVNRYNLAEFKLKEGEFELTIRSDKYARGGRTELPSILPVVPPVMPTVAVPHQTMPATAAGSMDVESPGSAPMAAPLVREKEPSPPTPGGLIEIKSPMVGTFYRSSSPDKPPYIKVGDDVQVGAVVCIIEAMKLFNEIESEVKGKVVKIMVEDASPVEYEQVLFLVDPNL